MRRLPTWTLVVMLLLAGCRTPSLATPVASSEATSASATPSPSSTATAVPSTAASEGPSPATAMIGWSPLPAVGPAAREDHTWTVAGTVSGDWALGGDGTTALLFGGRDGGTVFGDLWAFSFFDDSWHELPSEGGPVARFGHEAVWVDGIGLVVFAGQNGPDFYNDLWAYNLEAETWRQLPSAGAIPVARYGTCAAVAPDGRLWISHGFTSDGVRFSDTRAYDFASGVWTDETPAGGPRPVERCLHACWWTEDGALALFGGQTTGVTALDDWWLLQDAAWSEVDRMAPPPRNLYAARRLADATVVFGGQALDGSYLDDFWQLRDDDFDAIELTRGDSGPPARAGAEIVFDHWTGRGFLFGGRDAEDALADIWQFGSLIGLPGQ